jgi:hypothetical protein
MSQDLASNEMWNIEQAHASLRQIRRMLTDKGFSTDGLSSGGKDALQKMTVAVMEAERWASVIGEG